MFWEIEKAIKQKGMTNKSLASELNISQNALTNKLKGRTDFTLTEINKIKNIFPDIPYETLFKKED